MKKLFALVRRNLLEIVRDPLSIVFCIAFPVVMLVFMQLFVKSIPGTPDNFQIENYAMGICVFGYTFTSMFVAMNIASDKNSSFNKRIEVSPVSRATYLCSFVLSGLPVALCQTLLFFAIAIPFGFPLDSRLPLAVVSLFPSALFYISVGVLLGTLCKNEKQTGPINSIIVSLASMLGGVFMPINSFTGAFKVFVDVLPFKHTVEIAGNFYGVGDGVLNLIIVLAYTALCWLITLLIEKIRVK